MDYVILPVTWKTFQSLTSSIIIMAFSNFFGRRKMMGKRCMLTSGFCITFMLLLVMYNSSFDTIQEYNEEDDIIDIADLDPSRVQRKYDRKKEYGSNMTNDADSGNIIAKPKCVEEAILQILITSSPSNFKKRDAIRNSWCSANAKVQCIFLIGQSEKEHTKKKIAKEFILHQDICLGSYTDSYRNLTQKVLTGFQWSSENCLPTFLLKTDDDCFINVPVFIKLLDESLEIPVTQLYAGNLFIGDKTQVIRDPQSKWYLSRRQYADDFYPTYVSGTGYLLSGDVVEDLFDESKRLPSFPNEDAYIGVLAHRLGIAPEQSNRFTLYSSHWQLCNYLYLLVIHEIKPKHHKELLNTSYTATEKCQEEFNPRLN